MHHLKLSTLHPVQWRMTPVPVRRLLICVADSKHHRFIERLAVDHQSYWQAGRSKSARHRHRAQVKDISDRCITQALQISDRAFFHIACGFRQVCWRDDPRRSRIPEAKPYRSQIVSCPRQYALYASSRYGLPS